MKANNYIVNLTYTLVNDKASSEITSRGIIYQDKQYKNLVGIFSEFISMLGWRKCNNPPPYSDAWLTTEFKLEGGKLAGYCLNIRREDKKQLTDDEIEKIAELALIDI